MVIVCVFFFFGIVFDDGLVLKKKIGCEEFFGHVLTGGRVIPLSCTYPTETCVFKQEVLIYFYSFFFALIGCGQCV